MLRSMMWVAVLAIGAPAMADPGTAQQGADASGKDKLICKRDVDTGSLVAKKRRCHTRHDWDRIAEAARTNLQYEMDRNMSRPGGQ